MTGSKWLSLTYNSDILEITYFKAIYFFKKSKSECIGYQGDNT